MRIGSLVVLFLPSLAALILIALALTAAQPTLFTRDPLVVAMILMNEGNDYGIGCCQMLFGAVSTIGVMLWSGAAALALALGVGHLGAPGQAMRGAFFVLAALLGAFLALDDGLMLHEQVATTSISGLWLHAVRGALTLAMLALLWASGGSRDVPVLLLSLGCLAASVLIDRHETTHANIFLEDSLKFLGISLWASFFLSEAVRSVSRMPGT